jgi:hypothetical protein
MRKGSLLAQGNKIVKSRSQVFKELYFRFWNNLQGHQHFLWMEKRWQGAIVLVEITLTARPYSIQHVHVCYHFSQHVQRSGFSHGHGVLEWDVRQICQSFVMSTSM